MAKKTAADLRAENRLLKRANATTAVSSVLNTGFKYGALVWIAYYAYRCVDSLAGKTTVSNIIISFLGSIGVSTSLAYILAAGAVIYGLVEHKLRRRTIKRLGGRIRELESRIDPGRSTSNLTETGEPQPEHRR